MTSQTTTDSPKKSSPEKVKNNNETISVVKGPGLEKNFVLANLF